MWSYTSLGKSPTEAMMTKEDNAAAQGFEDVWGAAVPGNPEG